MAVKKTKRLNEETSTVCVLPGEKFVKVDGYGKVTLIDQENLKTSLFGEININCAMDGVFIMYHASWDNYPRMLRPADWPSAQAGGQIAAGVVVIEAGKILVVAPTDSGSQGLAWSSAPVAGTGSMATQDIGSALADLSGKANTLSIIAKNTPTVVTDTAAFAPGFCNRYSRVNANGKGLTAGKWWLPSMGELMVISANLIKINCCLSLISGATLIDKSKFCWSSTEYNDDCAWGLTPHDNFLEGPNNKVSCKGVVRPVSAFIL